MVELLNNESGCCGCAACLNICPKKAIQIKADEKGFLYPEIDRTLCVQCGLCKSVCDNRALLKKTPCEGFAFKHNNQDVLRMCSSGGASFALCQKMIENGGVVYGVVYDKDFNVVVSRESTIEGCRKFFGSKYASPYPGDSYKLVLDDLNCEKPVLYISTSCYIAGLLSFLKQKKCDVSKLVTVDFICHGLPCPKIFKDYLNFLAPKKDLEMYSFRSKKNGWVFGTYCIEFKRKNRKVQTDTSKARSYMNIYNSATCYKECCYNCQFVNGRTGDITISDFWGVKKFLPEFPTAGGVSAVQINSEKGHDFFNNIDCGIKESVSPKNIVALNLNRATSKSSDYDKFWEMYHKSGFDSVNKEFGEYSYKGIVWWKLVRLKRKLKKIIYPLLNKI